MNIIKENILLDIDKHIIELEEIKNQLENKDKMYKYSKENTQLSVQLNKEIKQKLIDIATTYKTDISKLTRYILLKFIEEYDYGYGKQYNKQDYKLPQQYSDMERKLCWH